MFISISNYRTIALVAVAIVLLAVLPHGAYAQQGADNLRATIQTSLLSDPRTAGLSEAQIAAIVDVLTQEAQNKGMTAYDIMWRPYDMQNIAENAEGQVADVCDPSSILCTFNKAFGFAGSDTTIPIMLWITSMGLIWILAEMLHRRRTGLPH